MTRDVRDLAELPGALREVLETRKSEGQLLDFLASLWSLHVEGDWSRPPFDRQVLARGVLEMRRRLAGRDRR